MAGSIRHRLRKRFKIKKSLKKIIALPSAFKVFRWNFLIETEKFFFVGDIGFFPPATRIRYKLKKATNNPFIKAALNSKLGKLFREFTPYFHIFHEKLHHKHIVRFTDLRYCVKHGFMHTGTIAFDENCAAIEQVFQPYSEERKITLA
jgi:inner membrane protein